MSAWLNSAKELADQAAELAAEGDQASANAVAQTAQTYALVAIAESLEKVVQALNQTFDVTVTEASVQTRRGDARSANVVTALRALTRDLARAMQKGSTR
jgi:hypothetical protein